MSIELEQKKVVYFYRNQVYEGILIYPKQMVKRLPGLLMVPDWYGINDDAIELASRQAQYGYVVFIADLYGQSVRPLNVKQASAAMLPLKNKRTNLRLIINAALQVFVKQASFTSLDSQKLAVFGFGFGGCCALELARSGAPIKATISFYANLDTSNLWDAKNIKGSILVIDGADDPLVPREQIIDFIREMKAAAVDWQLISYGGGLHDFANYSANELGVKQYNEKLAKRAFIAMNDLLTEVFSL